MLRVPTRLQPDDEELVHRIIGCALAVHRELGPGFLERTYHEALCLELDLEGIPFERERNIDIRYRGRVILGQRVDLIVGDRVVVEVKSVEQLDRRHEAQVLSYLRATGLRVALLMNFNVTVLKQGLRRLGVLTPSLVSFCRETS